MSNGSLKNTGLNNTGLNSTEKGAETSINEGREQSESQINAANDSTLRQQTKLANAAPISRAEAVRLAILRTG